VFHDGLCILLFYDADDYNDIYNINNNNNNNNNIGDNEDYI